MLPSELPHIAETAEQCLARIERRVEEEREQARLLRPVEQAPSDPLRPVMASPSGDPGTLLRSAGADSGLSPM